MGTLIDLTEKKFGFLTAKIYLKEISKWLCFCECGETTLVTSKNLRSGNTISCGCYKSNLVSKKNSTHGLSNTREYEIWCGVIKRCKNKKSSSYQRYGGAGIRVCNRWLKFENFFADMGKPPTNKHTIDRIDSDGDYEPANCRWATRSEQNRNKSNCIYFDIYGVRMTVAETARYFKVDKSFIHSRLKKGILKKQIVEDILLRIKSRKDSNK